MATKGAVTGKNEKGAVTGKNAKNAPAPEPAPSTWRTRLDARSPWISLVARLLLGVMWLYYAVPKLTSPTQNVADVRNFRILPGGLVTPFAYAQPYLELALGLLLIIGLGTRLVALLSGIAAAGLHRRHHLARRPRHPHQLRLRRRRRGGRGRPDTRYTLDVLRDLALPGPGALAAVAAQVPLLRRRGAAALARAPTPTKPRPPPDGASSLSRLTRVSIVTERDRYGTMGPEIHNFGKRESRRAMAPQDNNPSGKARDRAAAAYAADQAAARRKRQFLVGGIVAVVILAAIGIGIAVQHSSSQSASAPANGPLVFPTGTVAGRPGRALRHEPERQGHPDHLRGLPLPLLQGGGVHVRPDLQPYAQAGKIKVLYHIVNLIDRNDGGTGSIQAGSAAGCAQDVGNAKFKAYHDVLYANQPNESDDAFSSNATLISLAKQVPGLDSPAFEACVNSGKYQPWVNKNYDALSTAEGGNVSTPDYLINGQPFELTTQPAATQEADFTNALNKAIAAAG